jgi:hypothetical protein
MSPPQQQQRRSPSCRLARRAAALCAAAAVLLLAVGATASAAEQNKKPAASPPRPLEAAAPTTAAATAEQSEKKKKPLPTPPIPTPSAGAYVICTDQTYALCAAASAFVYQAVAYAKCVVMTGDSISAPALRYTDNGQINTICDANALGVENGYMMSTFSLPEEVIQGGSLAIYTCPGGSQGGYAQCDGGTCFKSTQGQVFYGIGQLADNEIICSCPIVMATTASAPFGWQFIGPASCDQSAFSVCDQDPRLGDTIPVGAPPGAGRVLTQALYGQQWPLNECFPTSV